MNQNPVIPVPVEFQGELLPGVEVVPYKDDRHGGYKVTVNDEDLVKEEIAKEYVVPPGTPISLGRIVLDANGICLLYTSPSPRDRTRSRMPSSA